MTRTITCAAVLYLTACPFSRAADPNPRVFPGAVGFGVDTPAGRGGRILRVQTLATAGPGSLRAAIEAEGPRIIVFEKGGVIDLEKRGLAIRHPFLTIAGETAPSPGITLIRGGMVIATHDILIRHIRIRPGDAGVPKRGRWEPDGITTSGGEAHDIVIDHCSVTWAVDENLSVSGPRLEGPDATSHRVTISNCIIAEALRDSSHSKGPHSMGSLIHDFCQDIAIIGNLYAHNVGRNPFFKAHTTGAIVNNVIYNPGSAAIKLFYPAREWTRTTLKPRDCRVSVVGHTMIHGSDTNKGLALMARQGEAYHRDNVALDRDGEPVALTSGKIVELSEKPAWPEGLEALSAQDAVDHVVAHAGARPQDRDDIDKRIVREFLARQGKIIDSQDEVGGYPEHAPTTRKLDVPERGVEAWLNRLAAALE